MVKRVRLNLPKDEPADDSVEQPLRGPGRPSLYKPEYARIAKILCSQGATDVVLADAFNVTSSTIDNWRSQHKDFCAALREGKAEVFDPLVERALAHRALGYSVDVEEVKITKDGDVIREIVRKHYPPDTQACVFWLKNRQPERWRDVWRVDHSGKLELEGTTTDQLLEEIRKEAAELGLLPEVSKLVNDPQVKSKTKH